MAMGRGDAGGFTVPAINVRAMAYDTARAVIRVGEEAERRRVHLRDRALRDRLHRAASARVRGDRAGRGAARRVHAARSSSRAITSRPTPRSTTARIATRSSTTLRALIKEEIAAGFYNIDIDTSTLVDLDKATLDEQQEVNVTLAADFTAFIREHEPQGVTVSVGGEIGEVGGKNSDVHELHAYMNGLQPHAEGARRRAWSASARSACRPAPRTAASSTPTARVRTDVKIDLKTLEELSRVAREEYGLGGAVQHGASTLPPDAFDAFPRAGACEIHLATDFQNMVYEHPQFPADLKAEMYAWIRENALEERKPKDTEEQFIYKARKKAIGPFKRRMWSIERRARAAPSAQSLEERFTFLMRQLKIDGTAAVGRAVRHGAAGADRSRGGDRRRRRQDHRGREEGRRARGLTVS